jgi:hypothetical protein
MLFLIKFTILETENRVPGQKNSNTEIPPSETFMPSDAELEEKEIRKFKKMRDETVYSLSYNPDINFVFKIDNFSNC